MEKQLLDWQALHDWASQEEPDESIGTACTNGDCPVANYLHERTGRLWSVGPSIRTVDHRVKLDVPGWVRALLNKVDNEIAHDTNAPISAAQFLEALDAVKPEETL